jgi:hypothetical protein
MIRLRRGTVVEATQPRPGVLELVVEAEGRREPALAYPALSGPVEQGDTVLLNTTALHAGLGSGGYHFVVAVEGQEDLDPPPQGHVMKLRYTPLQAKVLAVEEAESPDREALDAVDGLDGVPVVWIPLHSMLGVVCAGARAAGAERVVHVMTDGAALPMALSIQIHELREAKLLDGVVTVGHAFGGDREAVTTFSGLLAAKAGGRADVIVVGDGPGNTGTDTTWGVSAIGSAMSLHAVSILGGRPVAALRVSFADPRPRHRGVSHHSLTALSRVASEPVHIAVPILEGEERAVVWEAIRGAGLEERHQIVEVTGMPALEALRERGVAVETMGRTDRDDPAFFLAAGAAGVLAGRMAAGTARWEAEARA